MATNLNLKHSETREHRLDSTVCWTGNLQEMSECNSSCGGVRKRNKERRFSQAGMCPNGCAAGILLGIRDIAVILHGPAGCSQLGAPTFRHQAASRINASYESYSYGDDMNENDTIFGAIGALKKRG